MILPRTIPFLLAASCGLGATAFASETFSFHHDHVLGTSLDILVECDVQAAADAAEARILAEIARLSKTFSSYDASSEFSGWQASRNEATRVSPELFKVLAACDRWRNLSGGAFNPAVETMSQLWKNAAQRNVPPANDEIAGAVEHVLRPQWRLDAATGTATRLADGPLTLNAIAKGAIVDAACRVALDGHGEVTGLIVNIGGDLRVCGDAVKSIGIADPANDAVNAPPIATIHVGNRAVATSGNYRRGFEVARQWHSHVIDPRTGRPAAGVASATVVAATTAEANALAVAIGVLTTPESLALVESLANVECMIEPRNGPAVKSRGWSDLEQPRLVRYAAASQLLALATAPAPLADDAKPDSVLPHELLVKFELNQPGGRLRRPYVAVWLEDQDEFPVRTAVLWMQTKSPGPRWHRDLLRWYRNDSVRKLADGTDLVGTTASATRGPGEYKALFDGKDDAGKPLKPGKYTLFIEAAREHGTYQLIRHSLELGAAPLPATALKGNVEIKSASVEYRARAAATPQ